MSRGEEEQEVRSLLLRHKERIMLDLCETDLLTVLVKNSVISQSEEDLVLKTASAPSIVAITKRKISAAISSGSGSSNNTVTSSGGVGEEGCNSTIGCSSNNSCSASVINENTQSDNRSITPSLVNCSGPDSIDCNIDQKETNCNIGFTKDDLKLNLRSFNDAGIYQEQSINLIEIITKGGFSKFKQFCYAIDHECPKLIEDLFSDKARCDAAINNSSPVDDKDQNELESIEYSDKYGHKSANEFCIDYMLQTPTSLTVTKTKTTFL
ncbi:uncharacterized protein LOC118747793 isoform X3 [Rhagoletis pomonella]|uniref:uncharacterized protein LOC118747793 isoform X3 n=1 Tax=Rhagoletis pomonella TaxID=28610 RepID=UPI001783E912|nr:uncharacterized protein LOC118747793 isoform X3 [Rhagoletis pomonella]